MPLGILYWIVFLLYVVFAFFVYRGDVSSGHYLGLGTNVFVMFLLFLLGWAVFGFVVR